MAEPIPVTGYGRANWIDWNDNWRKADGDFLQTRSILRFAAVGDVATPEIGQVIYDNAADMLRLRSKGAKWFNVLAGENISLAPGAGTDVVLGHTSAAGGGLVFKYNAGVATLVSSIPFGTANNEVLMEASGLTIDTWPGTGGTAKLTTDATHLLSSLPLNVPAVKTVALDVSGATAITTLQATSGTFSTNLSVTGTFGVTGAATMGSTLTVAGGIYANGQIAISDAPTAATHAATKGYVDSLVATGDNLRVAKTGDTMTGALTIHQNASHQLRLWSASTSDASNDPYMDFGNTVSGAFNQLGYIQCASNGVMNIVCDGDVTINSGGGQVRTSDAIYTSAGNSRFWGTATNLIGYSNSCHLDFYPAGSNVDTIGSRYGWMGYSASGYMQFINEIAANSMIFGTDYAIVFRCSPNGNGATQTEIARFQTNAGMTIGGSGFSISTEGHSLWANGTHYGVTTTGNAANVYLNTINKVHGERWIWFERNAAAIGSIYQNGTTGTAYATTSDYRMKNVLGPVVDAWERFKRLKVYTVSWKGDPGRGETEDFLAHEVDEIVPDAVNGEKDAVNPDTQEPEMQMLAETRLVPLISATLQEAMERIEALEAQIAA